MITVIQYIYAHAHPENDEEMGLNKIRPSFSNLLDCISQVRKTHLAILV